MRSRILNVLLAFMLVAVVALLITGCSLFSGSSGSGDATAKLQTVNKAIAQAVVLAYQSGGNQLAYQQIDKAVTDGKITPEQAAQLKAAADKGIAALQVATNTSAVQSATAAPPTAPPTN